jgi:hypothetical protein
MFLRENANAGGLKQSQSPSTFAHKQDRVSEWCALSRSGKHICGVALLSAARIEFRESLPPFIDQEPQHATWLN